MINTVFAAGAAADQAHDLVSRFNNAFLFPLIALLSAIAFFVFIWGCAEYIMGSSNETARQQGVRHITYGIIGLVIMVAALAILNIAAATFGLSVD